MGESTCVMHPFSCATPEFSNENYEEFWQENENPQIIYGNGIGDSVSFGRFMTEELSWERWSSFNDNNNKKRYVEDAKKYSRPGSVAQKKAYFEAHFKRIAALKAAEQSDDIATQGSRVEFEGEVDDNEDKERFDNEGYETGFVVHQDENQVLSVDVNNVKVAKEKEQEEEDPTMQNALKEQNDENSNVSLEESSRVTQMDMSPLKEITSKEKSSTSMVKKNPSLSSYMPSIDGIGRAPHFTSSPASIHPGKENYATPIKPKSSKASKDGSPFSKTSAESYVNGVSEPSPVNSDLTKQGAKCHLDSAEARQDIKATEFKSPSKSRKKTRSPSVFSCFCWSSKERAARRKQEKAETEFNKSRRSSCFKAMPSPDPYIVNETLKSPKHKSKS